MTSLPTQQPRRKRNARGVGQAEEVIDLLYRRRWLIVGAVALAVVVAAALAFTRAPIYRTDALVYVDLQQSNQAGSAGDLVEADLFAGGNRSVYSELFVLNSSKGIRERVAKRIGEGGELPPGSVSFGLADRNVPNGIRISAVSSDPDAAAALANAYAVEYVAQTQIASRSYLTSTREFLEEQAERLRGQVQTADASAEGQMSSAGATSLGSGPLLSQLSALRAQLDEARINRQTAAYRLQTINRQIADVTPRLADRVATGNDRRLQALEAQIAEQEAALQPYLEREARGVATDGRERTIRARLGDLRRQRDELSTRYVDEVMGSGGAAAPTEALSFVSNLQQQASQERIAISGLDGRIQTLNSRIGRVTGELRRAPSTTISLERTQADREAASQTYASVRSQLEQVRVQEASEPGYARILREAPTPFFPEGSSWTQTLGLALLLGLGGGLGLAIARDRLDSRVYKPEHVTALGVPVLEAIPDLDPVIKDVLGGDETRRVGDRDLDAHLVTIHAPLSPASETYRHLRTAVQFSRPDTVVQTIVVTSPGPGEGKSTTAANLAAAFAQGGRATVLVDADLRRPRVDALFDLPPAPGLHQMLGDPALGSEDGEAAGARLRDALDAQFRTGVDNLYVVPAGAVALETAGHAAGTDRPVLNNPAEVLGSVALRDLIAGLRQAVEVVVIDTPPVLVATDAVVLASQADATILVASAGGSKTGDIEQTLSHLDDVGAHVIGAVLNRFTLEKALGYAYTYGHYTRYGSYSKYTSYDLGKRPPASDDAGASGVAPLDAPNGDGASNASLPASPPATAPSSP